MRILAILAFCLTALSLSTGAIDAKPNFRDLKSTAIAIEATPFVLDGSAPERTEFGKLIWLGGIVLTSASPYFGGYSGLTLNADGTRMLAVSDAGLWLAAGIEMRDGRIAGLVKPRTGSLRARHNRPLTRGKYRDAEAMAPLVHGALDKPVYIGFEHWHRVGRFPVSDGALAGPTHYLVLPKEIENAEGNAGIEALAHLTQGPHKGAVLALAERFLDDRGDHRGWLLGDKAPKALSLERLDGFDVTGAAALPDGDVLVLERRFNITDGAAARLRRIAVADIAPGARLKADILLDLRGGMRVDNMEGVAVHRSAAGQTIVTLISDDNFNRAFQRTLVMQFAMPGDAQN